ncbi:MAG: response regulator transcription factor, partial [Candidatus Eremiobacteraeota bacterium]|nr:response regulator transcription factor [Candidatus Eremiobacteraeota bacterium]
CARGCGDDATATSLALRLGRVLTASGSLLTALDHFAIALRHAPRPLPTTCIVDYAGCLQQLARDEEAATFLRAELRDAIERGDASAAAEILTSYCSVALTLERFAELEVLWQRVESLLEADAATPLATLRTARLAAYAFSGRVEVVERDVATLAPRWADHRALSFTAGLRGDDALARSHFEAYQAGLGTHHARLARGDAALDAMLGLFSAGNAALTHADDGWGADGDRGSYATGTALRIVRRFNEGSWTEADAIVAQLPLDDPTFEEPYAILDARLLFTALARRAVAAPERTLRSLRALIAHGRRRHAIAASSWYWIACANAGANVPGDVRAFVASALDTLPMPYLFGGIPLSVSLLAPQLGRERCAQALDVLDVFGSRWHRAQHDLASGTLLRDATALRRARDSFDALDAPAFAMLAGLALPIPRAADVALARRLGFTLDVPAPRAALTARERDVAELAAQGLSNREIATCARMSERTVEVHLTKIFRKLGVRSRSALAHAILGRPVRES